MYTPSAAAFVCALFVRKRNDPFALSRAGADSPFVMLPGDILLTDELWGRRGTGGGETGGGGGGAGGKRPSLGLRMRIGRGGGGGAPPPLCTFTLRSAIFFNRCARLQVSQIRSLLTTNVTCETLFFLLRYEQPKFIGIKCTSINMSIYIYIYEQNLTLLKSVCTDKTWEQYTSKC